MIRVRAPATEAQPFATTNMQAICGYGDIGAAKMGWLLTVAALAVVFVLGNYP